MHFFDLEAPTYI